MFQLFKQREFSDYINDTFQFFKQNGKHYLRNYFTISGVMLLLMVAIIYLVFNYYFESMFRMDRSAQKFDEIGALFSENLEMIIGGGILIILFLSFLHMLNYSIPIIYLNLYDKNKGDNFEYQDILKEFKSKFRRIFMFFLATFFLITPFIMIILGVFMLLSFVLVGIPLLLFGIPAAFCWITLSFYEYLNNNKRYFEAIGAGYQHLKKQFFPIVGSVMILFLIMQICIYAITFIPTAFGMASVFTSLQNPGQNPEAFSGMGLILTVTTVISTTLSFILYNLLFINQGLVYYSHREADENKNAVDSIDWIGVE